MTQGNREQIGEPPWPRDLSFDAYCQSLPLNRDNVYGYFFEANRDRIKVQNARMAVPRLQTILDATFRISSRRGYHGMSLRDLCQETGISMGGLYNYMSSKEELATMVTEFVGDTFVQVNEALLPSEQEPRWRLESLVRAHVYMSDLFRSWYFFVYMETKNMPSDQIAQAIDVEQRTLEKLEVLIEAGIADGVYAPLDVKLAASALLATIQDWYVKAWHFRRSGTDVTTYADFVVESGRRLLGVSRP